MEFVWAAGPAAVEKMLAESEQLPPTAPTPDSTLLQCTFERRNRLQAAFAIGSGLRVDRRSDCVTAQSGEMRNRSRCRRDLEDELQSELDQPGRVRLAADNPEGARVVDIGRWAAEY